MTPYVALACLIAAGLTFAVSAWSKARGRATRAAAADLVRTVTGLSGNRARAAAAALIATEAAVPMMLAVPAFRPAGIWLTVGLSAALLGGVLLLAGRDVPCACFGEPSSRLSGVHAVRNAVLLTVAIGAACATPSAADTPAGLAAACAGTVLCLFVIRFEALHRAFR
ncbi:hypothetical protein KZ829_26255 [Actinoplanes hulinensis]|uniref:Methylamine utilisation protein MauE domain-containing protein n=1 Tax=Actinoplanes hulinensis TaxID=1144547 RepID=A0ABS7BAE2_9ACTN|nr:MauE/DoxX family redox-associated membrane protein [Actinoplanes hulinensis]MBW6437243.1 hypothetical protein [Actinoplanes hulinensis]